MSLSPRTLFASLLILGTPLAATGVDEGDRGPDLVTRVFEVPGNLLPGIARDEVRPNLESLGTLIGDPSSVVYDFVAQRLIVRSTNEKVELIEAILAWGSEPDAEAEPEPALRPEEAAAVGRADEYALRGSQLIADGDFVAAERHYIESLQILPVHRATEGRRVAYRRQLRRILERLVEAPHHNCLDDPPPEVSRFRREVSDVHDKLPNLPWDFGPPERAEEILLPNIDFSATPLEEALAHLESEASRLDPQSAESKREMAIHLDAPGAIPRTPITLQLSNAPLSEAIRLTAELAFCRVFHHDRTVIVSCIDLLFPALADDRKKDASHPLLRRDFPWNRLVSENETENWRKATSLWESAFWKLHLAERAARLGDERSSPILYYDAFELCTKLAENHPDFHADLVWARIREISEKLGSE